MTKVSPEVEANEMEAVLPVSADVSFASDHFPKYKLGPDNQILEEPREDNNGPSLKDVVEQETTQLSEQHKRLSVRDLASKFDKNLTAAAKLSEEAKLREVASLEGHVLLKKLRDALEHLRGRMAGRNKEDVEKAISMVEALAVKLTQNEGELIQEKFEVKKLANFLKQASEDAKKLVNQEKSFACAEIESARAVVQRIGEALDEQARVSQASKNQAPDVEGLVEEVQEARRIKLLHQPIKVMEMEHELRALRTQIREKFIFSVKLQKELAISKRAEENKSRLYVIDGMGTLGSCLRIQVCSDDAPQLSKCSIQWYRVSLECSRDEDQLFLLGADKPIYAPEPLDVGRILQADIASNGQKVTVMTAGPIDPGCGEEGWVTGVNHKISVNQRKLDYLSEEGKAMNTCKAVIVSIKIVVTILQMNGQNYSSHSVHAFHVGKMRMKLSRGWITKAREIYSPSMQLCGYRGGSNTAAKTLFWQARKGLSFVLAFESERDRNAAIVLARKYALDCNVMLAGPDDQV
ncbi:Stomatal closure-related actin-binding protein [Trema orientale]|uniref:Stomatal closure-related actin-binding protein n=1 Tax=Trema orientale TaxID=63057 RepID=A0A2P5BRD9_TREOI|nr:Stomatal closure-related actin-binding protein [Trema orientale]